MRLKTRLQKLADRAKELAPAGVRLPPLIFLDEDDCVMDDGTAAMTPGIGKTVEELPDGCYKVLKGIDPSWGFGGPDDAA